MIITIGNTKGGVGKTTLAINLAIARALQGKDIWLIDGDRQATAINAVTIRTENNRFPSIACSHYSEGSQLRGQVKQQGHKYEEVIIDVGGRDSTSLRAALIVSDILLVPFQPRSYDVWALADMSELIEEARSIRDNLVVYALLNLADPSGKDNQEAKFAVNDMKAFEYLNTPLSRRKSFANAAGQGLCVLELKTRDIKAENELNSLLNTVFQ